MAITSTTKKPTQPTLGGFILQSHFFVILTHSHLAWEAVLAGHGIERKEGEKTCANRSAQEHIWSLPRVLFREDGRARRLFSQLPSKQSISSNGVDKPNAATTWENIYLPVCTHATGAVCKQQPWTLTDANQFLRIQTRVWWSSPDPTLQFTKFGCDSASLFHKLNLLL